MENRRSDLECHRAHTRAKYSPGVERPGFPRAGLVLLALVTIGWGLNWPIIKRVLDEVPPLTFRGACLLAGGLVTMLLARVAGQSLKVRNGVEWARILALSACNVVGWNVLVVYGVARLPSGRAALLGYTMPIWSMTLSLWLLGERFTARRAVALALAMIGVLALLGADLGAMASSLTGVVFMLGAAMSWGLGVVLLKRFALAIPTLALTAWMIVVGAVPVLAAAILLERHLWHPVSAVAALGLVYNIVVSFILCYWAWNRLVLMVPVAVSSISSLATPVVGVLSGIWLLDEALTWRELVAGSFILAAIALVVRSPAPARQTE